MSTARFQLAPTQSGGFSVSGGRPGTLVPAAVAGTQVVPLEFEKPQPSYAQLEQALRDAIIARKLPPGSRLPEERALAKQFSVSRGTVRRALAQLE
ncbi:MAG TPA: winged helix-turn-helix domain-containing protein, partial [Planctomycetota bacterium]|nr:winged helix-turn-helix domain-containing protein [Planctomycetota bacterium]